MIATGGCFEPDHEAYRASVQQFLRRSVMPGYGTWSSGCVPRPILREAGESGFLGIALPEEYGGAGVADGRFAFVMAQESMLSGATGLALSLAAHGLGAAALACNGDDQQRKRWLPRLVSGEQLTTLAIGAELSVDGTISGTAVDVVSGSAADLFVVVLGDRLGLVAAGSAGLTVDPGAARLGAAGAGLVDLHFKEVAVELLPVAGGSATQSGDMLAVAMLAMAGGEAALAVTIDYVQTRKVFGRPLAEFENTTVTLADVAVQLAAARALLDQAISVGDVLSPGDAAATVLACTTAHVRAADEGLQLHGGYGYMREYPIAAAFADAGYLMHRGASGTNRHLLVAESLGL